MSPTHPENEEPAPLETSYTNSRGITLKVNDIIVLGVDTHEFWFGVIEKFKTNKNGDIIASIAYLQEHKTHIGELVYSYKSKGNKWRQDQSIASIIEKLDDFFVSTEIKERLDRITVQEYEEFNDDDNYTATLSTNFETPK